jgi:hypothetical protein
MTSVKVVVGGKVGLVPRDSKKTPALQEYEKIPRKSIILFVDASK